MPPDADEDEAVVRRIAAGDRDALAALYDRHAPLLWSLALRVVRNPTEAEDVVQEAFVQAWRQADRWDAARGSVGAWLCTIARTRALDRLRRRATRREADVPELAERSETPAPERSLAVRQAMVGLPAEQRRALELAYFEGLTQSEIAERLQEPLGTVKTRIRTAMIKLRGVLEAAP